MVDFAVYEPPNASGDLVDRAERLAFVKDGFHWMAALVPALWLIAKGLWIELLVCIAVIGALTWGPQALGINEEAGATVLLIAQVIFGFEAGAIESAALERKGWRQIGFVEGRNFEDCERRFIARWLPSQPDIPTPFAAGPMPKGPIAAWTDAALRNAKDTASRWRQRVGAKA